MADWRKNQTELLRGLGPTESISQHAGFCITVTSK